MATSASLIVFAAPAAAPPSMIAMRLPTGLLEGSAVSESARTTRIDAGSRSRISPSTVDTRDSWPWPELELLMTPVIAPERSTRTRQESIQVVFSFFGFISTSKAELPPLGSRQVEMPIPARRPERRERAVEHRVVVARVVGRAAGDGVGKLVLADEIPLSQFDPVHAKVARDAVDRALDREIGRRLAEAAHRLLGGLVGHQRDRLVLDRLDRVRPADRGHRFAELEGRASRVGADVVHRADLHRTNDSVATECDLHVEEAVGPLHVAAAQVFQAILDQAHGGAELLCKIPDEHGVLDAALHAVAAADVDVVMHAHGVAGQAQRARRLIGELGHLDRGPDVEDSGPRVPLRGDAEGLDRH